MYRFCQAVTSPQAIRKTATREKEHKQRALSQRVLKVWAKRQAAFERR